MSNLIVTVQSGVIRFSMKVEHATFPISIMGGVYDDISSMYTVKLNTKLRAHIEVLLDCSAYIVIHCCYHFQWLLLPLHIANINRQRVSLQKTNRHPAGCNRNDFAFSMCPSGISLLTVTKRLHLLWQ